MLREICLGSAGPVLPNARKATLTRMLTILLIIPTAAVVSVRTKSEAVVQCHSLCPPQSFLVSLSGGIGNAVKHFESFNPWPKGQVVGNGLWPGLSATG